MLAGLDDEERTKPELADRIGELRAERMLSALNTLVDEKVAYRTGRGVKGHPYRWRLRTSDDPDPDEHEQTELELADDTKDAGNTGGKGAAP